MEATIAESKDQAEIQVNQNVQHVIEQKELEKNNEEKRERYASLKLAGRGSRCGTGMPFLPEHVYFF